jgi:Icc-related predicted phosphoesterase
MKALVLADIDDLYWKGGEGQADLVIACGDISDSLILGAANAFACQRILAVKGNHDPATPFPKPIVDLHLRCEKVGSLTFGGLNGSWKYKPKGHFLYEQEEAERMLVGVSPVDVFVSHNSPLGVHDKDDEIHTGFRGLLGYIQRSQPRLLIHGHQHRNCETMLGKTRVLGVYGHSVIDLTF